MYVIHLAYKRDSKQKIAKLINIKTIKVQTLDSTKTLVPVFLRHETKWRTLCMDVNGFC